MVSITFDDPLYLWYLLSIPLLVYTHFYLMRHTRLKAMTFANFEALRRVSGERLITKNITILTLRTMLLCCIILAVSGTTVWYEGNVNNNDLVIAIDTSASMAAQDIEPTRFIIAKLSATELVQSAGPSSKVALVSFSGTTFIEKELTSDRQVVEAMIRNLEIAKLGGTDIPGAIITSTNLLSVSKQGKTIILITDGSSTASSFISEGIQNSIEYANKNHVTIHTLGIGSDSGPIGYLPQYYNISAVYNEQNLLDLSNKTGGRYFKINNEQQVKDANKEIESLSKRSQVPLNLGSGLMALSLFILFIEWGLISTRFRRIP